MAQLEKGQTFVDQTLLIVPFGDDREDTLDEAQVDDGQTSFLVFAEKVENTDTSPQVFLLRS
jgi:hypothetical protein